MSWITQVVQLKCKQPLFKKDNKKSTASWISMRTFVENLELQPTSQLDFTGSVISARCMGQGKKYLDINLRIFMMHIEINLSIPMQ